MSNPLRLMRHLRFTPDPWQEQILLTNPPRLLLNCCRQAGKSTTVAVLALAEALFTAGALVLILSRSQRQSAELFRSVADFYRRVGSPLKDGQTNHDLRLSNRSRIVSLPCQPDTVRGFAAVRLLIIDEAARVPDDLYRAVRPMLAVSGGRLICLSTPYGKRGFFYDAWAHGGRQWTRIEVHARNVPRITADFLDDERRSLGDTWFRQEYCCSFEALQGLVYPDFSRCVVPPPPFVSSLTPDLRPLASTSLPGAVANDFPSPPASGGEGGVRGVPNQTPTGQYSAATSLRLFGGLDFGFRNPFAAVWGVLDRDDVLWLVGEHYARQKPLSHHAQFLPRRVRWYADPAGAGDIAELRLAGFKVSPGDNALRPGIAAVTARLESGRLKVVAGACPNLLAEADLYRYGDDPTDRHTETPVDDHNHALAALRYLVSKLDSRTLARMMRRRGDHSAAETAPSHPPDQSAGTQSRRWLRLSNPGLWRVISRTTGNHGLFP